MPILQKHRRSGWSRRAIAAIALLAALFLGSIFTSHDSHATAATSIGGLHVQGNQLINGAGQPILLHGVDRSGTEYACIQGWGIFDGPSDLASVQSIASWKTNAVRVPLNEDCWLAINGAPAAYSGAVYQTAVTNYVNLLTSNGLVAILDLHWNAAGATKATSQQPMADRDHASAFWKSVAGAFKGNSSVIFDLYNEPYPDNNRDTTAAWTCWRDGGSCAGVPFTAAGMQELVSAVRSSGATNVILLGGVQWGGTLTHWLSYKPVDPGNNLAASTHLYNFGSCITTACYDRQLAPVAAQVPLIAGEIGENDCQSSFIAPVMNWFEAHQQSYVAWAWDTSGTSCSAISLISSYAGTPATAYGQGYMAHLAGLTAPTSTPTASPTPSPTATPTRTPTPSPTPSPGFTTTGTATPGSAPTSSTEGLSATVKSATAMTVLVDLEIYSPSNTKVFQQYWSNQTFAAGQTLTYSSTWPVPATAATGNYTVEIGVFNADWSTQYVWNSSAAQFSVSAPTPTPTPAPSFSTKATVSPTSATRGSTVTITAGATSATTTTVLVDVEVYNAAGAKVFQQYYDNQALTAGQTRTYSPKWAIPTSTGAGTYTVKVGIFQPGWAGTYTWNDSAAQFAVR